LTGPGWPEKQKIFFHLGRLGPAWAVLVWGGPVPVICLSWAGFSLAFLKNANFGPVWAGPVGTAQASPGRPKQDALLHRQV